MPKYVQKLFLDRDNEVLLKDADGRNLIVAEAVARQEGDTLLHNEINDLNTALSGDISNLDTRLSGEISDLDTRLSGEISDLDTRLSGEISDLDTSLGGDIAQEALDRANADTALYDKIKSMNYVNVKDYGALGDGVTDDSQAFKNAINAVAPHATLFIPYGEYKISEVIQVHKPMTMLGEYIGWDVEDASNYVPNSVYRKPLIRSLANGGFEFRSLGSSVCNVAISITGSSPSYGLQFNIKDSVITTFNRFNIVENVSVYASSGTGTGFLFESTGLTRVSRCLAFGFATGFWFYSGGTSLLVDNCWAENNTSQGFYFDRCYYSVLNACACDATSTLGYVFNNCRGVVINGCGCELTQTGYVFSGCRNVHLSGIYVFGSAISQQAVMITNSTVSIVAFSIDKALAGASYVTDMLVTDATSKIFIANTEIVNAKINGVSKTYTAGDIRGSVSYATL